MKKSIIIILSIMLMVPIVVNAESHYLYDVLKDEANSSSGLAREYTGEHNDVLEGGNKKIYYWYSETAQNTYLIRNKWNVLFADKCWEAFRTTDGGGTKLIYNGIPVNNTCKDDRTLKGDYYNTQNNSYESDINLSTKFSKSYTTNLEEQKYYMTGEMFTGPLTDDNYLDLIGMYTCQGGNESCTDIYEVFDYSHSTINSRTNKKYYYYTLRLIRRPDGSSSYSYDNNKYYSIGNIGFTEEVSKINRIGYMYDKDYELEEKNVSFGKYNVTLNHLPKSKYEVISNDGSNLFTWNSYYNRWEVTVSAYNSAKLKFKITEAGDYVLNWGFNCDYTHLTINRNGVPIKMFRYSPSIWSDKNIVIKNVTPEDEFEILTNDSYGDSLEFEFYVGTEAGTVNDTRIAFGNSYTYENGKYILQDILYSDGTDSIKNNHYTCLTHSIECEKVFYATSALDKSANGFELINGQDINYILNELYYKDDINKRDSIIKKMVDLWFEDNLLDYQDYLEPTIYCNNRQIINKDTYYLNPNGGTENVVHYPNGTNDERKRNIYCPLETDQFSINNPKAKLKYSVGLSTAYELNLAANNYYNNFIFSKGASFNTMSPYNGPRAYLLAADSSINYSYGGNHNATRPVITLKSNVKYISGDGSKENPYIIDNLYKIDVEINNETEDLTVEINDLSQVTKGEEVNFKVTPIKGRKLTNIRIVDEDNNEIEYTTTDNKNYSFIMPASNVTIIPSYERVKNAVNVEDNKNTKEFVIEVNDATAVVYEDTVRFRLQPEEGYEVEDIDITDEEQNKINYKKTNNINEFEFTMPDTDVTISPKYRKIDTSKLINPNTKRQIIFVIISIILLGIITSLYTIKKKRLT